MKKLVLFFIVVFFTCTGFAQPAPFNEDSIPVVHGEVVFTVRFQSGLSQEEFHKIAYSYLTDELKPYSGTFLHDDDDHTICMVTDYLNIVKGVFQSFGMFMTYRLQLSYRNGVCNMVIKDIRYMEKSAFEAKKTARPKTTIPEWSGKEIMIDHKYHLLLIGNVPKRITRASLDRINGIIKDLDESFEKK
jgi:hypothetical protein